MERLALDKRGLGAIVSAVLLVAIFVPFQRVDALSVTIDIPSEVEKSGAGTLVTFRITLAPLESLPANVPLPVEIDPGNGAPGSSLGSINLLTKTFDAVPGTGTAANLLRDITVSPPPSDECVDEYSYYCVFGGWIGEEVTVTAIVHTPSFAISNTDTLQTLKITVKGMTFSKQFLVKKDIVTPSPGGGGGGGGRGGGAGIPNVDLTTYPGAFFELNPLKKLIMHSIVFLNLQGAMITQALSGEQVMIGGTFRNSQQVTQGYAFIMIVTDQDGNVIDMRWQTGTVESGKLVNVGSSWTPRTPGMYTVNVLVWDKITGIPTALSEGGATTIVIVESQ